MTTLGPIPELTSARYTATLLDETGAAVPSSSLTTLTLTLYGPNGQILNSRNQQSVLNQNGVTVDSNGNLVWTMAPADNAIVNDGQASETHYALFQATWAGGTKGLSHQVAITVQNMWRRP